MKSNKLFILLLLLVAISGCGGGGGGGGSTTTTKTLVSIAVTPANPNIAAGTNQQFSATGTYSDSTTQDLTNSVTWTSSDTGVATIVAGGLATAIAAGSTTITAASGGVLGATSLTVTSTTLVSIAVTPANPSIAMGTTQQFTATGTFSNSSNQNITTSVTWSSTASSVATVSNTGIATPVAAGTTTITAVSGTISASTTLTVTAATLVSIAVTPANPSVALGTTEQFTATGTFSSSSTQNITASVTWSSTASSVATISNTAGSNGNATPVAAGTTTITALSGNISGTTTLTVTAPSAPGANVVPITVNGSQCVTRSFAYVNKPCVSVTICSPGTSTCQTINDILLDTGSYGLRILSQALTVPLTQVASGSGQLAECVDFGDGASEWGLVEMASVILGTEPAVQIPIHVVNYSFGGTPPSNCNSRNSTPDTSPSEAGFNGILGVGLFAQDCGSLCTTSTSPGNYYSCNGTTCTGTTAPMANQVINPVAALPGDNNGVLVQIQSVALGGVPSVNGNLILGIGTQTNNQPATAVTEYPADPTYGQFTTTFNGQTYSDSCFIDSGSNGLFFEAPRSLITQCSSSSSGSGYFCETPTTQFSATNSGYLGSPTGTVNFEIGNATTLFNTSNNVFIELGANSSDFDWGLPFFFGRNVYVGIEGKSSSLGAGPFWAY